MSSVDSTLSRGSTPPSTTTATSQDMSASEQIFGKSNDNFKYIYSFLGTLIFLLLLALAIFLRALMRRRRLDNQFNVDTESANAAAMESRAQRRRKKRRDYGEKPKLLEAWIGEGPLPTSLSTEALLDAIQPFSVAREPTAASGTLLNEKPVNEQLANVEPSPIEKEKQRIHYLSLPAPASASSCSEEKVATRSSSPIPPVMQEIEQVQVGFLIVMPRPPPLPLRNAASSSSLSLAKKSSTSNLSASGKVYAESFWSLAESKWSDHLAEGELPELNVGISTIRVPVDSDQPLDQIR